jgi:hypothetical protein
LMSETADNILPLSRFLWPEHQLLHLSSWAHQNSDDHGHRFWGTTMTRWQSSTFQKVLSLSPVIRFTVME